MRPWNDSQAAVLLIARIDVKPDGNHPVEHLARWLHVTDALFLGPGTPSIHFGSSVDGNGLVLMPWYRPVSPWRLVEVERTHEPRLAAQELSGYSHQDRGRRQPRNAGDLLFQVPDSGLAKERGLHRDLRDNRSQVSLGDKPFPYLDAVPDEVQSRTCRHDHCHPHSLQRSPAASRQLALEDASTPVGGDAPPVGAGPSSPRRSSAAKAKAFSRFAAGTLSL